MNVDQLAAHEPLSPESVLVLPPELRVQAIARLGPPNWPTPRPRVPERVAKRVCEPLAEHVPEHLAGRVLEYVAKSVPEHVVEHVPEYPPAEDSVLSNAPLLRSLGTVVAGRVVQLGLIFLAVTLVTLAMSVIAHAMR